MKIFQVLFLMLFIGVFVSSCKDKVEEPTPPEDTPSDVIILPECESFDGNMALANNQFGFDLFKKINAEEPDNMFISPVSISVALGMTQNGGAGNTAEQIQNVLKLNELTQEEFNQGYFCWMDEMNQVQAMDNQVQMDIANSIWYGEGFPLEEEFKNAITTYFNGEANEINFGDANAKDIIHQWISDNTNEKITEIIDQIPPDIVMYLINAVYFKGNWKYEFDVENTADAGFYKEDGSNITSPFMEQQTDIAYFETEEFEAIDLPYGDDLFSMTVFLPKNNFQVNDIVEDLNDENWATWMAAFEEQETIVKLPKFTLEYKVTLNESLRSLGMTDGFDAGNADFSNINPDLQMWISRVLHKTFVEVNEVGTEAAAVTVVEVVTESAGPPIPTFNANHPFFYVIRDKVDGSIVFMGKMMEPKL